MISRSNITENQVENVGIAPYMNVTRRFFFKKSCKSIILMMMMMMIFYSRLDTRLDFTAILCCDFKFVINPFVLDPAAFRIAWHNLHFAFSVVLQYVKFCHTSDFLDNPTSSKFDVFTKI